MGRSVHASIHSLTIFSTVWPVPRARRPGTQPCYNERTIHPACQEIPLLRSLKKALRRRKYGEEVIVVSGLPRSGTSMMMRMLDAAGVPILTDNERPADVDNPKGYYEHERVKDLENETDKSWVGEARGKVLKVISHLLKDLPSEHFYKVIFMRRDLDEVVASQNKMLERRDEDNPLDDLQTKQFFLRHLVQVQFLVRDRSNFQMIEVHYKNALDDPAGFVSAIDEFLEHGLDVAAMAAVVDQQLYRNRKAVLKTQPTT